MVSPPVTNFQRQWVGLVTFSLSRGMGSDLVCGQHPVCMNFGKALERERQVSEASVAGVQGGQTPPGRYPEHLDCPHPTAGLAYTVIQCARF